MRASLLFPFLLLASCHQEAPEKETVEQSSFSFTIVSGELPTPPERFLRVTEAVYPLIKQEVDPAFVTYTETVPHSENATFDLIPIPGGEFTMGSPPSDPDHKPDELPAHQVQLSPFWIATTETTWAVFQNFLTREYPRNKDGSRDLDGNFLTPDSAIKSAGPIDMITSPTEPYTRIQGGPPASDEAFSTAATGMTRHTALKFCQWLSAQTGHFYRLPTEAEWEYACRAGTTTAYSFDNLADHIGDYGIYYDNWDYHPFGRSQAVNTHPVKKLKPNPWGLFDMHGNASEWTLDAYSADYQAFPASVKNPITFSPNLHQGVVRGGNFDSDPHELRSAARLAAHPKWNDQDPMSPQSIWYNASIEWNGFRIVRPLKVPSLEEAHLIWNLDSGKTYDWSDPRQ